MPEQNSYLDKVKLMNYRTYFIYLVFFQQPILNALAV